METVFQVGALERLGTYLKPLGAQRVLILSTPSRRYVERAIAAMPGMQTAVFDQAKVHVPQDTVTAAIEAVDALRADTLVALGGGAAIGLGKALCLHRPLTLVALATTYSGSEMTNIYGISAHGVKTTGRDERVRARLVLYDAGLTTKLPLDLTIQSLCNSLAQIVSALSTDSLQKPAAFIPTAGELWQVMNLLRALPEDISLRERALRASSRAGEAVDAGNMGYQHALAHSIGTRYELSHSSVHSILLPAFMAWLRRQRPELARSLDHAAEVSELEASLYDLLRHCGATVSLRELGVTASGLRALLKRSPELPAEIAWDAYQGIRPCAAARHERAEGMLSCLRYGPEPERAHATVLALHGRGANAGRLLRDVLSILGDATDVTVVVPQAPECVWYPKSYRVSLEEHGQDLIRALERVGHYLDELTASVPEKTVYLFGFSQGACLALETAARRGGNLGGVIAICGARIGLRKEQPPCRPLTGVPVLLGAAEHDSWLDAGHIRAAAEDFTRAGADVRLEIGPGDKHEITALQRSLAREIIT